MQQNSQNPYSMWMDVNKNMFDAWNAWAAQAAQTAPWTADRQQEGGSESAGPAGAYFDFLKKSFSQNPMLSFMSAANQGAVTPEQIFTQWQNSLNTMSQFIPNKAVRDSYDRFMSAGMLLSGLRNYWDTFLKGLPKDVTDFEAYTKQMLEYYRDMSKAFIHPFMPEQIRNVFFSTPLKNIDTMQYMLSDFFQPLLEGSETTQNLFMKAMTGDSEAYIEFLEAWKEMYKNSFSKIMNIPAVGSNRESIEKMMKFLDLYVNFTVKANECSVTVTNLFNETMGRILDHLGELQAKGDEPQTFLEFYAIWSGFNEKAFEALFSTDEFAKLMNDMISVGSKLKIILDDLLQDSLSFLPFTNSRDFNDIGKVVFDLRKRVNKQEKELKELREQLAEKSKP